MRPGHMDNRRSETGLLILLAAPASTIVVAFFIVPLLKLLLTGYEGAGGIGAYFSILLEPHYLTSLAVTVFVSVLTTIITLALAVVVGTFLSRHEFPGHSIVVSLLALSLAFPGVVVGFLVIILGGRQGIIPVLSGQLTGTRIVFAYSFAGLLVAYVYFSLPRAVLTVMATASKLDRSLEEAARSLGATQRHVVLDVIVPGLHPALISAGAICFATSMGAFGTAFALGSDVDVLSMLIYSEFTQTANVTAASALSLLLGFVTWLALAVSRNLSGNIASAAA